MNNKLVTLMIAVILTATIGATMFTITAEADKPTSYYTYTPTFISTATDAESVKWDFGDGTILDSRNAVSSDESVKTAYNTLLAAHGGNVWAPKHTYADNGSHEYKDYTVTQTVYNPYNGGSEDSFSSTCRIMGHPVITLKSGSSIISSIEVPKAANYEPQVATEPTKPSEDNRAFIAWCTDAELKTPYDWASTVPADITLYAMWDKPPVTPATPEMTGYQIAAIVVAVLAIIACAILAFTGHWAIALIVTAIGTIITAGLWIFPDMITSTFSWMGGLKK